MHEGWPGWVNLDGWSHTEINVTGSASLVEFLLLLHSVRLIMSLCSVIYNPGCCLCGEFFNVWTFSITQADEVPVRKIASSSFVSVKAICNPSIWVLCRETQPASLTRQWTRPQIGTVLVIHIPHTSRCHLMLLVIIVTVWQCHYSRRNPVHRRTDYSCLLCQPDWSYQPRLLGTATGNFLTFCTWLSAVRRQWCDVNLCTSVRTRDDMTSSSLRKLFRSIVDIPWALPIVGQSFAYRHFVNNVSSDQWLAEPRHCCNYEIND